MRHQFDFWVGKIPWRRDRLPTPVFLGFPGGSAGKESACNAGDLGLIPGSGRSPGEGKGCPLQYSGLENSIDCIVHGVAKSRTWLSDFHVVKDRELHFPFPFYSVTLFTLSLGFSSWTMIIFKDGGCIVSVYFNTIFSPYKLEQMCF